MTQVIVGKRSNGERREKALIVLGSAAVMALYGVTGMLVYFVGVGLINAGL